MSHDLKLLLLKEIDEKATFRRDSVVNGKCSSFEDYRRATGVIEGLMLAKSAIEDFYDRLKVDSDVDQ